MKVPAPRKSSEPTVSNTVHVPSEQENNEIRARVEDVKLKGREYVEEAARLTLAVFEGGFIGKGRLYPEQGDYAKALGVSGGTISGWLTYGRALALGVEGSDAATVYAHRQSVGKALKGAKSKTAAMKAVRQTINAKAKADAAKATERNATRTNNATAPPAKPGKGEAWTAVEAALDTLRKSRTTLTADQRRTVVSSLSTLLAEYGNGSSSARSSEKSDAAATA